jgi:hypothetical protein
MKISGGHKFKMSCKGTYLSINIFANAMFEKVINFGVIGMKK